ncbi:MAG: DUF4935 domain-containing protein [Thermoleophilia bacterium]|nr:DUF4935 domain-containing protein [Thermoleophilia bacterium]
MDALIFIDTNIYLDFYQYPGRDGPDLPLLPVIDRNRELIITSSEVEMEYKKNRQRMVTNFIESIDKLDWDRLAAPAFISASKAAVTSERYRRQLMSQMEKLKGRAHAMLSNPVKNDPVYQVLQRLFRQRGPYNLYRTREERHEMRDRAWRRFILGYPPRKPAGLSIGDAINWEWLVKCAQESRKDVVVVTRDTDFGSRGAINDWLAQEFRERVGRTRNVHLTGMLSQAFSMSDVEVSSDEARKEEEMVRAIGGDAA